MCTLRTSSIGDKMSDTPSQVFCHSAITGAEQDHEIMVQSMVNEQDRIRHAFADLFHLMDKVGGLYGRF